MCGIAGWVAFDNDLTNHRNTLAAMTEPMACRGPDASGVWLDRHVGFGHRRLAVIDIEGGAQPMSVEADGRTLVVTTYSGELYNFLELREELEALGHTFRTRSDTEVALHAYLEWGTDFTSRLNGMYAFALWDPRSEELILVRDRMGIKPLYYYPTPDGVLFGSEPKAILAHPDVDPVVDLDGLPEMLTVSKTPGHAIYRGMKELRPGHLLRVRSGSLRVERYWALESHEHTDDLDTTVGHVRELLDDIVQRQLISDVPLCTLLSGGLDSSVITALAAKALGAQHAGPVRSFAVDFVGHTENFQPDEMRGTPDGPYAHALAEHVGSDHSDIVLDTAQLIDPANKYRVLAARDLPVGLAEGDTSLYLLFKAIRAQSTVALSGESADEVFGGYRWFHDADAVNADTFPWLASFRRFGGRALTQPLWNKTLLEKANFGDYIADRYSEALSEVPRLEGETGLEARMREICYLHLTRFVQTLLDRKDRASMAVGLEVRVPFCDHRLVQYVFNTPWSMKTFDGREKSLLRAATRDVLPESVAERVKSPYPSTQDSRYDEAVRTELKEVLADPRSPVLPLLDVEHAQRSAAETAGPTLRWNAERVLQVNTWLSEYNVQLDI
ncbi:MAG TPA: asparagine synthase (glutamine-hydrolyzing) [Stackebrandtia sp.]|jgi:asparagine synthase (glutamine-hydrolysing)|uniref:asparagine synthase (glutamine-hydrolyzing) n=1 Tax=Stackebrandtia sp. TaxID=2023065 RepID=UPI002D46CA2A|nr:asparagine synthase (glutamine-hydrolyzing) [Stackebrandtia sp.]HZE40056.1 asparagine synthase (glutamine-hydrolyzing) [Stackebrandtia sp.]